MIGFKQELISMLIIFGGFLSAFFFCWKAAILICLFLKHRALATKESLTLRLIKRKTLLKHLLNSGNNKKHKKLKQNMLFYVYQEYRGEKKKKIRFFMFLLTVKKMSKHGF